MKFILQMIHDYDDSILTFEFENNELPSVLANMEQFLRGCGYHFKGTLEIVEDDVEMEESP